MSWQIDSRYPCNVKSIVVTNSVELNWMNSLKLERETQRGRYRDRGRGKQRDRKTDRETRR